MSDTIEHMFDSCGEVDEWDLVPREEPDEWVDAVDPEEWEPIPDEVLAEVGVTGPAGTPEDPWSDPAGHDDWVLQSQLQPVDDHTLSWLNATPVDLLSVEGRSVKLRQLEVFSRYVDAQRAELVAVIAGPVPVSPQARLDDYAAHEVAVASLCSVYAADRQVWLARDLASRLTRTAQALRLGEISMAQASALSQATIQLDDGVAQAVEDRMLRFSHRQNLTAFKQSLRRWVAKLDPDFTRKATEARKDVEVSHTAFDDGTGQLYIRGPLELTTTIHMALTAHAAKTKSSLGGTEAQRKLAGLRDWAEVAWAAPDTPRQHGRLPNVNVTIDLATLLGLTDRPAEIPGVGPIPASAARWLIADGAQMRRMIIDDTTGKLLDYGHTTYTAPPDLTDYLIALNVHSMSPHSAVPAEGCDMEHNTPYDQGGPTNPTNNTPVDRRWHRAKTHGDWTYQKDATTGSVIWTSPTGLTCQIDPHDYRP